MAFGNQANGMKNLSLIVRCDPNTEKKAVIILNPVPINITTTVIPAIYISHVYCNKNVILLKNKTFEMTVNILKYVLLSP